MTDKLSQENNAELDPFEEMMNKFSQQTTVDQISCPKDLVTEPPTDTLTSSTAVEFDGVNFETEFETAFKVPLDDDPFGAMETQMTLSSPKDTETFGFDDVSKSSTNVETHFVESEQCLAPVKNLTQSSEIKNTLQIKISQKDSEKLVAADDNTDTVEKAIREALCNNLHWLQTVRSYQDKTRLLQMAVKTGKHDIVLAAAMFIRKSLSLVLATRCLSVVPLALHTLLSYYDNIGDTKSLIEIYTLLHRYEDAGMHLLNKAIHEKDRVEQQKQFLNCSIKMREWNLEFELKQVELLMDLYQKQDFIENHDREISVKQGCDEVWNIHPRYSVIGVPLFTLISYTLTYHQNAKQQKIYNSKSLRDKYEVNPITWIWLTLRVKARLGDWIELKKIGNKKRKQLKKSECVIGFRAFVEAVVEFNGPKEDIEFFISRIIDHETRYDLAIKHDFVIIAANALLKLKDKFRLAHIRPQVLNVLEDNAEQRDAILKRIDNVIADKNKGWAKWKRNK